MKATLLSLLYLTAAALGGRGLAATITVTSIDDGGPGSLRAAIAAANSGDTINFAITGAIVLTTGELFVHKPLKIVGPGATNLVVRRSEALGTPEFRVFHVEGISPVTISGLTIGNGLVGATYANGGGVLNEGFLTLNDCVVSGNRATGEYSRGVGIYSSYGQSLTASNCLFTGNVATGFYGEGGGIYALGKLTVVRCQFVDNTTSDEGAGLDIDMSCVANISDSSFADNKLTGDSGRGAGICNHGNMNIHSSTVSGNIASGNYGEGGGIYNYGEVVSVINCTFSGNSATGFYSRGGGIHNDALFRQFSMNNCTISGNSAPEGSGIYNAGSRQGPVGLVSLRNSIAAGNTGGADVESPGTFRSLGGNLVGTTNGGFFRFQASDRLNITAAALKLGPLADNGGPTLTRGLRAGSPAIDALQFDYPQTDQRGVRRPVGLRGDVGAFEGVLTNTPPAIACPASASLECSSGVAATISVNVSDADGDALTVVWKVDGVAYQTNNIPAGTLADSTSVEFTASFESGEHEVLVTVTDGESEPANCSTVVTVRDTTPPTVRRAMAMPGVLWPPNGRFVPVRIIVQADDNCGPVHCRIKSVRSNEAVRERGHSDKSPDWIITGDLALRLRAERSGSGRGRIYTITVECEDAAGNKTLHDVTVTVPRNHVNGDDRRK